VFLVRLRIFDMLDRVDRPKVSILINVRFNSLPFRNRSGHDSFILALAASETD